MFADTTVKLDRGSDEAVHREKLTALIPRWLARVPLYQQRTWTPNHDHPELLDPLPQITKKDIRHNFPHNFLASDTRLEDLVDQELVELEHTSGTSEPQQTPLLLELGWWARQEEKALRLNAFVSPVLEEHPQARRATISSPVCNSEVCYSGVPPLADRIVGNTLFCSLSRQPFLWSEEDLSRLAREVRDWQPVFLDVDPVYGIVFALYCERHGIRIPSLRFILCSYEFVSAAHRRILSRVFNVPVFNLYGSTETGHLLMEDTRGRMIPSLETAYLELCDTDSQGVGALVVTTLTNDYMPLIRYRIGDLVRRSGSGCETAYEVHGREADAFRSADGSRSTPAQIDCVVSDTPGIAHYQVIQRSGQPWLLRFVPDIRPPTPDSLQTLQDRLTHLLQPGDGLEIQPVNALMPESSGKFRLCQPLAGVTNTIK
jgi:phenylacetate-CoA ligase